MPGMRTKLNLMADSAGVFEGENMQFNGDGFHEQKFDAIAMTDSGFKSWVGSINQTGLVLSSDAYEQIAQRGSMAEAATALGLAVDAIGPQGEKPALYFVLEDAGLFDTVLGRYRSGQPVLASEQPGSPSFSADEGRAND